MIARSGLTLGLPFSQQYLQVHLGSCWSSCLRAGRWVDATSSSSTNSHARTIHTTAAKNKNLLKQLINKSKKKTWYETPPRTPSPLNLPKKKDHGESHRCKILNMVLFKAVNDLLNSAQLSYELQRFDPQITKVSLSRDFSNCRVFWRVSGDAQRDELVQRALEKNAAQIRYLIMSQQIVGGIPPIVFLRDKQLAAISEVDRLLQEADFGPNHPEDRITAAEDVGPPSSTAQPALYGIDHQLLNKQIADWRQQSKTEEHSQTHELQQEQLLAIAEHRKQQIMKKRKRKASPRDDDITPRAFLLAQQDMATPQGWGRTPKEEPEESSSFKDEEANLRELASLDEKMTS